MSGIKWAFRRVGIMGFVVSSLATVAALQVADGTASAASTSKHTICHRTHATTNPYRRITVSVNAIFNQGNQDRFKGAGHSNAVHNQARLGFTPDVDANNNTIDNYFDPTVDYSPTQKKWGDIIPPYVADSSGIIQNNDDTQNYGDFDDGDMVEDPGEDFTGKRIFDGDGDYSGLCESMTAAEFVSAECSAENGNVGPGKNWPDEKSCIDDAFDDLDDQAANDDLPLKTKLGGFSNWRNDPANQSKSLNEIRNSLEASSPRVQTSNCDFDPVDGDTAGMTLIGKVDVRGVAGFAYFEWGTESDLSDFVVADNDTIDLYEDGILVNPLSTTEEGSKAADVDGVGYVTISTESIEVDRGVRVFFRLVNVVQLDDPDDTDTPPAKISTFSYGSIRSCVWSFAGGGGGGEPPVTSAPATTETPTETSGPPLNDPPADPKKKNDDPKGPKDEGPDDITKKLSLDPKPNQNDPSKGGTIEINKDPSLPPPQVTGCEIDNPDYECEIKYSGPEYNNPKTWEENGFGDECWKIDPGGYSYTLPDPPQPPSGTSGGVYSVVVVKAGSLRSTDPNFQVNTLFYDPSGNTAVWPDSNKDGVYNPGGRYGDKEISHIIFCVTYGSRSNSSTTSPATTAPATTSPSSTGPSTSGPATTAPATTAPATTAPATTTPATPRPPQVEVRPKAGVDPVPDLANLTIAVSVGTDEEVLIIPIDLTNFVFKNALPELPVTGSDTDTPRNLAIAMVLGGLVLYGFRRRLFVKI